MFNMWKTEGKMTADWGARVIVILSLSLVGLHREDLNHWVRFEQFWVINWQDSERGIEIWSEFWVLVCRKDGPKETEGRGIKENRLTSDKYIDGIHDESHRLIHRIGFHATLLN
jgi:hypothetical protein